MGAHPHQEKVKMTIECTRDERMYIKMLAAKAHQNLSEFILSYVREDFPEFKKPNKETLEAMKEIDEGGGIECDSIDDFWKKMGISRA
ncbi:MAG: hypothetical protein ACXVAJ_08400 [Parachlamydiaceae bacterium]